MQVHALLYHDWIISSKEFLDLEFIRRYSVTVDKTSSSIYFYRSITLKRVQLMLYQLLLITGNDWYAIY